MVLIGYATVKLELDKVQLIYQHQNQSKNLQKELNFIIIP